MGNTITGDEPAFPVDIRRDNWAWIGGGMTLRQYYIGQAIAGLCSKEGPISSRDMAARAVAIADATIEALNKPKVS